MKQFDNNETKRPLDFQTEDETQKIFEFKTILSICLNSNYLIVYQISFFPLEMV